MGRPLKHEFFGDPQQAGTQIPVQYWDNTANAVASGFIVKQLGSKRFRCTNGTTDTSDCRLSQSVTQEGEMTLTLNNVGTPPGTHVALKISGRTATLETGEKVSWTKDNVGDTINDGVVDISELVAGTTYEINTVTDGNWTLIGATTGLVGEVFTATGPGTGTGDTAIFVSNEIPNV